VISPFVSFIKYKVTKTENVFLASGAINRRLIAVFIFRILPQYGEIDEEKNLVMKAVTVEQNLCWVACII
jgi:hypothetical protein